MVTSMRQTKKVMLSAYSNSIKKKTAIYLGKNCTSNLGLLRFWTIERVNSAIRITYLTTLLIKNSG